MKRLFQLLCACFVVVSLAACSGGGTGDEKPEADVSTGEAAPEEGGAPESTTPTAPAPEGTATIKGTATLKGTAPKMIDLSAKMVAHPACLAAHAEKPPLAENVVVGPGGELANAFVYVSKGLEGKRFPRPADPVKFDQKGCIYRPHVFGIQVGQTLEIHNSDETLHNVHTLPKAQREFNSGHPKGTGPLTTKFRRPEPQVIVKIKCDVHPWMNAWAGVLTHPFFAVTNADGSFEFPEKIPPGTYTITAWHETYDKIEKEITVADGATEELSLVFEAQ